MGGDIVNGDGTGSQTVYDGQKTMKAEANNLKFSEPYLLVAPANDAGETGSQFMVTLQELPALNGSSNTIFGRLLKGTRTLHQIEGFDELKRVRADLEKAKDQISQNATAESLGLLRRKRKYIDQNARISIQTSGVYKIGKDERQRTSTSAVGQTDFVPLDFME